jgi:ABC-type Na+ efflux pump permease subunit
VKVIFGDRTYQPPDPAQVEAMGYGRIMRWYLSSAHTFYISLMFFLRFVLVTPSILVLRRIAQSHQTMRTWLLSKLRLTTGDKTRKPRHVWSNPIAWREAKTKASANRAVMLRYGFMLAGIAAAVILLVLSSTRQQTAKEVGAEGINHEQKTLTVVSRDEAKVWALMTDQGGRIITSFQLKTKDGTLGIEPDELRPYMVVEMEQPLATADRDTLQTLVVSHPRTLLTEERAKQFLLGAAMVELAVILLIITQSAASTVTREKEDGTLDLLLSTPITSRYYIWGKLRGLVSFALPLMAVPVVSVLLFVVWDLFKRTPWLPDDQRKWMVYPESVIILPGTLVMVAAFASILGMQMSLRCRKTVMAVMASLGIVAGVCGGLWVCGLNAASSSNLGSPGLAIGCFSPFTLMALLINPREIAGENFYGESNLGATDSRLMVFFAGWVAIALYAFSVWGMYKSMVKNFDMTIRRQAT